MGLPGLELHKLKFALVSFSAAIAALYISMSMDLRQPYWSMIAVFIVSQPTAAAARSKAIQRLLGTLLGAAVAVALVPGLVATPLLLSLALSAWVGGCLAVSLLDRTPRSYILMLAGYTAAIVGFSSVGQPEQVFDLAVARAEEITVGIVCASLAHSLWFPRAIGDVLHDRIAAWLAEADAWALDILADNDAATSSRDRSRLAAAASEIHIMSTHLPFDVSRLRETGATVHALHDRLLLLIPRLSSLADRLAALGDDPAGRDDALTGLLDAAACWIRDGSRAADLSSLQDRLAGLADAASRRHWPDLERIALLERLQQLLATLAETRLLLDHLHQPGSPLPDSLRQSLLQARERPLHSDAGLALVSGAAALVAIMTCCLAWIGLGWAEGGASAMLASILCCLFAGLDDPAPAIRMFGLSVVGATLLAGTYQFVVFPAIDSFPMLALVLAPPLLVIAFATLDPRRAGPALVTLLNFCNAMAIQERYSVDFASFLNANLSQFLGVFVAIYVTRALRSMSTDASAQRLLRQTWRTLAELARGRGSETTAAMLSRLVDRAGLLSPRLAATSNEALAGLEALADLRTGVDLDTLRSCASALSAGDRGTLERLLQAIGDHYAARAAGLPAQPALPAGLINGALRTVAGYPPATLPGALAALVGLRTSLFADGAAPAGLPEAAT